MRPRGKNLKCGGRQCRSRGELIILLHGVGRHAAASEPAAALRCAHFAFLAPSGNVPRCGETWNMKGKRPSPKLSESRCLSCWLLADSNPNCSLPLLTTCRALSLSLVRMTRHDEFSTRKTSARKALEVRNDKFLERLTQLSTVLSKTPHPTAGSTPAKVGA